MSPWDANLAALDRHHPGAARILGALGPAGEPGEWFLSRSGDPTVRRRGSLLASTFNPRAEARKAVPDWDDEVDFCLLPGLGAGYLAEAVSARYPDLPMVVAEEDPRWFAEVLAHRDLTALLDHPFFNLILGPDPRALGEFLGGLACRSVSTLVWRPLADQEPAWHRALADQTAQAQARSRVNQATFRRFADLWRRNLSRNEASARNVRPLSALAGSRTGSPAVIAAAGPSLAEAFPWMEAHRDRYVLVAVDTAWPSLAARGIEPDFLLILDGQYWNSRHVDRRLPERTLVVTEWTGPPRAFRLAPGRTFTAATGLPLLRRREEERWGVLGNLPSGGSVATAAWGLAVLLGCREVAFAGLDLGYPRGLTHVAGSQFEEAVHRKSGRLQPAETLGLGLRNPAEETLRPALDGGTVVSDHRMDLYRTWLAAAAAAHPEIRAVNLGTRGSLVPGLGTPGPDYGAQWPRTAPMAMPTGPYLSPRPLAPADLPFKALAAVSRAGEPDFSRALDIAWEASGRFWGPVVWDQWSRRVRTTWDRFPSPRSRRAVSELVQTTLGWEAFWTLP